ncbi:acyltransferase family protein [Homoserinimonas sp. A447]
MAATTSAPERVATPATISQTPHTPTSTPRYAGLDGLRAIAVITVILFHLTPGALPGGFLGVDIFFVISGFLITSLLLSEHAKNGRIALGNFWRRRARRLLPALGVLLLTCCTAAWMIGSDLLVGLGQQVLGAATFSGNWLAIAADRSYFDATTPELLRNLWSLAVEEQFYLLWPLAVLLLLLTRRRWVRVTIVAVAAVASAVGMTILFAPGADATRVYYGTDTHSFGLTLGAVLALLGAGWSRQSSEWRRAPKVVLPLVGLAAVAALIVASFLLAADGALAYQGGLAVVALLSALAILGSIVPGSYLGRALDIQPLRWIGERSYGLYLWHWPVFVLVVGVLPTMPRVGGGGWILGGIAAVITVVAAAISYRFVEQPIRRNGVRASFAGFASQWNRSGMRAVGVAIVGMLVLAGSATTVAGIVADPGKGAAQTQIEAGQQAVERQTPPTDAAAEAPEESAPAALPGGDQITAIGDSVMLASATELQNAFPGIQIDATVSRQLSQAPQIVESMLAAGTLRPTVVIGLGTNGPIDVAALARLRELAGTDHQLVLVNVFAPRWWTEGVNANLSDFAQQYRAVELANWRDSISGQLQLLARDQIHPGDAGGRVYVGAVRDALQRLSELPPLLGPRDFGLAPLPT